MRITCLRKKGTGAGLPAGRGVEAACLYLTTKKEAKNGREKWNVLLRLCPERYKLRRSGKQ